MISRNMGKLESEINSILTSWNPLSVPEGVAKSEYLIYIPEIIKSKKDSQSLTKSLG